MAELVISELRSVGLHLNSGKTKILHLSEEDDDDNKNFIDINEEFV